MEENKELPMLTPEELRVIGSLLEKSKTTPEYYPMTLNALQNACNQKSSRKPVVQYDEGVLMDALNTLRKKGLVSTVVGGGSRVTKYKHNFAIQFPLLPQDLAVLCLLILRGPLTPGEINSNSGRLYDFESIENVVEVLDRLASGEIIYVKALPKVIGQKEIRYIHLLGEFDEELYQTNPQAVNSDTSSGKLAALEERVEELEQKLSTLQEAFDKLMNELS